MFSPAERHSGTERREHDDRRKAAERRAEDRRRVLVLVPVERRSGGDRREGPERRTKLARRRFETAEEHVRNALQLLDNLAASAVLDDELRRDLDSAMLRLRVAVERLERGSPPEA